MKIVFLLMMVVVFGLCTGARAEYQTEVTVDPVEHNKTKMFAIEVKIFNVYKNGKRTLLSVPRILTLPNHKARVQNVDKNGDGILSTVMVNETDKLIKVLSTIIIKKDGIEKLNTHQTMTIKKHFDQNYWFMQSVKKNNPTQGKI